ncbi:glycosyltransferase family 4 protein [Candidatus Shapirobacteria bacterium]|nr:glycosyltransferase family 4 protein [Candidatus Shapirobacteria bacterium]
MNKIRVHIDDRPLKNGSAFRGVGEYTRNLIKALSKEESLSIVMANENPDIVHYPSFDPFFLTLPILKKKPIVVTVHDIIPLVFPEHFPPGIRGNIKFQIQKISLGNAAAVITDSENSRKDIEKYLGCPEEKVFVIPLAPAGEFKQLTISNQRLAVWERYKLPDRFILYVGDVNYNKNILGLVGAFSKLKSQNLKLLLIGKAFENRELPEVKVTLQLIEELDLVNEVKVLGFVPTKDLVEIYNLATVYCQPSFYEGFGLPVLEAMACGCPVVAANTASLPEICGNAARMVDPHDVADIALGLEEVSEDEKMRRDLIRKGLKQAGKFTWEKVARETIGVYEKVLSRK